ncbi:MAG: hypothetical protein JRN35_07625 [Nitrososphaerota archaeon]|nr:hypothetical protein [Nitrososphaerota archaeon]
MPIGVTVVDKHATRQLQLSEDMEKAVHDFIEDTTSLPSLVVDLSLGNRAVEEAALFIRGVFRE